MARNEEKQYSRLNRLLLRKDKEEHRKRNPKRPKLDSLNSVEDIKEWLPSIKRDLDFSLKQSEVTCYSEQKIAEIQNNICQLEREFKSFVRKSKQMKPGMDHIPWTNRPYKSNKTDRQKNESVVHDKGSFVQIKTPILEENVSESDECKINFTNVDMDQLDRPLKFKTSEIYVTSDETPPPPCPETTADLVSEEPSDRTEQRNSEDRLDHPTSKCNLLGLDYSSSDSDT